MSATTTTPTHDVNATLQQIAALNAAGVDTVPVALPRPEGAGALAGIAAQSTAPGLAGLPFQGESPVAGHAGGGAGGAARGAAVAAWAMGPEVAGVGSRSLPPAPTRGRDRMPVIA